MRDFRGILLFMLVITVLVLPCGTIAAALELTVILPGEQTLRVTAAPEETVQQVKEKVYAMSEVNPLNQVVFYKGNRLDDSRTLSSYNVGDGDTLRVEHGVLSAPTAKQKSGMVWILLTILIILGVGIFFMRKKPSREYDGR